MDHSDELAEWLRSLPDDALASLLRRRPDLAVGAPGDFDALAARAASRGSVAAALDGCDAFTLAVAAGLALTTTGGPARSPLTKPGPPAARLGELADPVVPGARVQRAYDQLVSLALATGAARTPRLLRTTATLVGGRPLGLGRGATACLADTSPRHRAELNERLGADPTILLAHLDSDRLASLPADELAVLREVDSGGGLGALQGALGPLPRADDPSPARRLQARGLLLAVAPDLVELPREVGLALRGAHPLGRLQPDPPTILAAASAGLPSRGDVAEAAAAQAWEVVRLVEALLERLSAHPAAVLKTGALGQREHRALARALDLEEPAVSVLLEVAHAARLLARDRKSVV